MKPVQLKTTQLTNRPNCPRCAVLLDAATDLNLQAPRAPHKNDVTICIECGLVLAFTESLSLRRATIEEIALVKQLPVLWQFAQEQARRYSARVN